MKLAVLTTLIAIALPVPAFAADWVLISNDELWGKVYIDRQSIRTMPNGYKRAWRKRDLTKVDDYGTIQSKVYDEYDCIQTRDRTLNMIIYKENGTLNTYNKISDWNYVAPETKGETLLKFVCRK